MPPGWELLHSAELVHRYQRLESISGPLSPTASQSPEAHKQERQPIRTKLLGVALFCPHPRDSRELPVGASGLPATRRMASLRAAFGASLAATRTGPQRVSLALPSSAPWSTRAAVMEPTPRWLAGLRFDNRALRALPVEMPPPGQEDALSTPRQVPGACFSRARPAPLRQPRLVALSEPALALLGLEASEEAEVETEAALFFSGNALLPGAEPAAHCYCGHQFGQFAGQLGDGAAMYLGEVCTAAGERWELQLKGAGPTPFSRCGTWGTPRRKTGN